MDWFCEFKLKLADSKRSLLNINLAIDFIYVIRFFLFVRPYFLSFALTWPVPICSVCAECMHNLDLERQTTRRLVLLRYQQSATSPPSARWIVSFCCSSEDCWCWFVVAYCFEFRWLYSAFNVGFSSLLQQRMPRCHFSRRGTELILPTIVNSTLDKFGIRLATPMTSCIYFEKQGQSPQLGLNADDVFIYVLCIFPHSLLWYETIHETPHKSEGIMNGKKKRNQLLSTENLGDVVVFWNGDKMCLWHISSSDRWLNLSEILFVYVSFCWCCHRCAVDFLANWHQFRCYCCCCINILDVFIHIRRERCYDRIVFAVCNSFGGAFAFHCVYCRM